MWSSRSMIIQESSRLFSIKKKKTKFPQPLRTSNMSKDLLLRIYILFINPIYVYSQLMYVRVFGTIRVFKEEKAIVGTHIKKVEKFDEVSNHLL